MALHKIFLTHSLRKTFLYFLLSVAALTVFQVARISWYSFQNRSLYRQLPYEQKNPQAHLKILFLGDSTAVGTGAKNNRLSVAGYFGGDFPRARIVNLGENGQKLRDLIRNFHPSQKEKYTLVVMQIGANDILHFTPLSHIKQDLTTLLGRAKAITDCVVILHSGNVGSAPIFSWPLNRVYAARTKKVKEIYLKTAKEKGAFYIDLFQEINDDVFLKNVGRFYSPDYLHPSGEGYRMWYNKIREKLQKANIKDFSFERI